MAGTYPLDRIAPANHRPRTGRNLARPSDLAARAACPRLRKVKADRLQFETRNLAADTAGFPFRLRQASKQRCRLSLPGSDNDAGIEEQRQVDRKVELRGFIDRGSR